MKIKLMSTSVQTILVMWDVLVVNGTRRIKYFVMKEPDYNITIVSTFSGLNVPKDNKEGRRMVNGKLVKFKYTEIYIYMFIYIYIYIYIWTILEGRYNNL